MEAVVDVVQERVGGVRFATVLLDGLYLDSALAVYDDSLSL